MALDANTTEARRACFESLESEDWERARTAVLRALATRRTLGESLPGRGSGLVIVESNGRPSDLIRLSVREALEIGLKAIVGQ